MEKKSKTRQSPIQNNGKKTKEASTRVPNPLEKLRLSELVLHKMHKDLGNLEYLIAKDNADLSEEFDSKLSFFATPEECAKRFIDSLVSKVFLKDRHDPTPKIFLKHTFQSRLGTHCIFGLQYQGFEIEEHSFAVHVDKNNHVVMVCCTYLPYLPKLLGKPFEALREDMIRQEIAKIGEYESAAGEKQWLMIWDEKNQAYELFPGDQVKLTLSKSQTKKRRSTTVVYIFKRDANVYEVKELNNSAGLSDQTVGLGEVIRKFEEKKTRSLSTLMNLTPSEAILQDMESSSELIGKYAAIKDEIQTVYTTERHGIFLGETGSAFDRVTAYYHLDHIQRYFRERLGFRLLDEYSHLNPVTLVLRSETTHVAEYDINAEKIMFYKLGSNNFTAVRDPRLVYHEFVHAVTDAIARLHRAGQEQSPRTKEILQAQAMDEGIADYFACSLAQRQGAKKALAYYMKSKRTWGIVRDLDPKRGARGADESVSVKIQELQDRTAWKTKKYELAQLWGQYLWQLRKSLGDDIADMLIAHSIFFLTRWATFEQGGEAILLTDRLLFSGQHQESIGILREVVNKVKFV